MAFNYFGMHFQNFPKVAEVGSASKSGARGDRGGGENVRTAVNSESAFAEEGELAK